MDRKLAKKYLSYIEKYPPSHNAYIKNFVKDVLNIDFSIGNMTPIFLNLGFTIKDGFWHLDGLPTYTIRNFVKTYREFLSK